MERAATLFSLSDCRDIISLRLIRTMQGFPPLTMTFPGWHLQQFLLHVLEGIKGSHLLIIGSHNVSIDHQRLHYPDPSANCNLILLYLTDYTYFLC